MEKLCDLGIRSELSRLPLESKLQSFTTCLSTDTLNPSLKEGYLYSNQLDCIYKINKSIFIKTEVTVLL
jgi:hypothetical protein